MMLWEAKCWSMLQLPWKRAVGVPNSVTLGESEDTLGGIALRGKNQIRIYAEVHSIAYTPRR